MNAGIISANMQPDCKKKYLCVVAGDCLTGDFRWNASGVTLYHEFIFYF